VQLPASGSQMRLELLREFIGGPGTDDLEVTEYHGRTLDMLKDGLGSIIALVNRGGNPVAKIAYDAWAICGGRISRNMAWPRVVKRIWQLPR